MKGLIKCFYRLTRTMDSFLLFKFYCIFLFTVTLKSPPLSLSLICHSHTLTSTLSLPLSPSLSLPPSLPPSPPPIYLSSSLYLSHTHTHRRTISLIKGVSNKALYCRPSVIGTNKRRNFSVGLFSHIRHTF